MKLEQTLALLFAAGGLVHGLSFGRRDDTIISAPLGAPAPPPVPANPGATPVPSAPFEAAPPPPASPSVGLPPPPPAPPGRAHPPPAHPGGAPPAPPSPPHPLPVPANPGKSPIPTPPPSAPLGAPLPSNPATTPVPPPAPAVNPPTAPLDGIPPPAPSCVVDPSNPSVCTGTYAVRPSALATANEQDSQIGRTSGNSAANVDDGPDGDARPNAASAKSFSVLGVVGLAVLVAATM